MKKKIELEKQVKELTDKNNKLLQENNELKQSNVVLMQSTNPNLINNQSVIELKDKIRELEQEKFLMESLLEDAKKKSVSLNIIEEEKQINENKELKLKLNNLEKENKELKIQNDEMKKKIEKLNAKKSVRSVRHLIQSNRSNSEEEEFDIDDLANNVKKKNYSEDIQIDFPGYTEISSKYEELIKKVEEIKELFKEILSLANCDDPELQQKAEKICELLDINVASE